MSSSPFARFAARLGQTGMAVVNRPFKNQRGPRIPQHKRDSAKAEAKFKSHYKRFLDEEEAARPKKINPGFPIRKH